MLRRLPILQARRRCGLDVHKETGVAHVQAPDGTQGQGVRKSYGTMQVQLIALRTCLKQMKVTHIAMESTGVYWVPIWNVLEDPAFTFATGQPAATEGAAGTQERPAGRQENRRVLQDRRLEGSFVPPAEIRQLRILTRHRVSLLQQRYEVHNQIRDLLEMNGVKLASVASNLMGVSGQRILRSLAKGEASAEQMSRKAVGKLRKKARSTGYEAGVWAVLSNDADDVLGALSGVQISSKPW